MARHLLRHQEETNEERILRLENLVKSLTERIQWLEDVVY